MSKTLIGLATFGLVEFTKLAIRRVRETVVSPYDIYCVVGKPDDVESIKYFEDEHIPYIYHEYNKGFPVAVNDLYDYAWVKNDYDNLIVQGNDVLPYQYAIDSMIKVSETTDYEWICANQYDVKSLCRDYPETRKYFQGDDYIFHFDGEPWKFAEQRMSDIVLTNPPGMSDVQNLCLYKKSVFDKIGYTDPNFYPAYYIDNDYARRGVNAEIKSCTLPNSVYFHFWSRVIKQGSGGSTHRYFDLNKKFYMTKWGGDFSQEKYTVPFNGKTYYLNGEIPLEGSLKIGDRIHEKEIVDFWISMKR